MYKLTPGNRPLGSRLRVGGVLVGGCVTRVYSRPVLQRATNTGGHSK